MSNLDILNKWVSDEVDNWEEIAAYNRAVNEVRESIGATPVFLCEYCPTYTPNYPGSCIKGMLELYASLAVS